MKNVTFQQRMKYRFDNMMSKGPMAVIVWLALGSLLLVIVAGGFIAAFGILPDDAEEMNFVEATWQSLMRTLDAGTMGGDAGWGFRLVMLLVTIGGVFIVSALIGIISAGFDEKLNELRKGHSKVLESNHTLILGWSPKVYTIISELSIANENQKKPRIVVLSDRDKSEMEDDIKAHVTEMRNTKVICRSGDPLDGTSLNLVNFNFARSIIILPPENDDMHDLYIIKVALAIVNNPHRKSEPFHIVTEIHKDKSREVLDLIGKDEITILQLSEVISRMTVQVVHQPGLSLVIENLLKFEGDEIYFSSIPKLSGKIFAQAQLMFEDSSVIGVQHSSGKTRLNPPMDYLLQADDNIIAISEDDDTVVVNSSGNTPDVTQVLSNTGQTYSHKPVKTLVMGYNEKIKLIITEFANYFPDGSEVDIIVQKTHINFVKNMQVDKLRLNPSTGDITSRPFLDTINFSSINYVIILSEPDKNQQQADANTLITLLHCRDIVKINNLEVNIVSEMLDPKNSELARINRKNDFIVSEKLVSLLITMISENKDLKPVIDDLLDADGSEIYFKPIADYVKPGIPVDFYQLTSIASQYNQVAMGYRIMSKSNDPEANYGIVVNPKKSNKVTFSDEDVLIALSED
jgi:K+/H+ antiporter YhaU regulatory subunit KhtT